MLNNLNIFVLIDIVKKMLEPQDNNMYLHWFVSLTHKRLPVAFWVNFSSQNNISNILNKLLEKFTEVMPGRRILRLLLDTSTKINGIRFSQIWY